MSGRLYAGRIFNKNISFQEYNKSYGAVLNRASILRVSPRDFEESVSLCPTNPWVYYHRGIREFHLKKLADAKVFLELALEYKQPPLSMRKRQRAKTVLKTIAEATKV